MISWKVTTMGRVSSLEETLFSFINQDDLEDSEMIIINDYPLQELVYDHPRVKIFNVKEPFGTIGEKENFAVEQCRGDIIAVTDDDDVYMPNHNRNIKKYFKEGTGILHWNGVYYNEPNITKIEFIGNSGMVFSKEAWEAVGKRKIMNAGEDTEFARAIHAKYGYVIGQPPDNEVSAWYRWASNHDPEKGEIGTYHQSGSGYDQPGKPNIIERHAQYIENLRKQGYIPTGRIQLNPRWKRNYKLMLEDFCK
jgi:cellulose synthase/poly-beta-1,6-N-acetylglucosamine synthase-like glycosyltransferase